LTASLGETTKHFVDVGGATWTFDTPAIDPMVAGTLWRAGYLHRKVTQTTGYRLWLAGPENVFDDCVATEDCEGFGDPGAPMSPENVISVPSEDASEPISINVSCSAGMPDTECAREYGDQNGYAAVVYMYAANLVLEQKEGPSVSYVGGELESAPTVAGTSDVAFTASDPGSGIYQAVVSVDGQVVQQTVLDENEGKCRNVGQTTDGTAAFLYLQPCAASVSADVSFDTRQLSNGAHRLVVDVTDPAGNVAPVLEREITVANPVAPPGPGPVNGANASAQASLTVGWAHSPRADLTVGYGHVETVVGRLLASGGVPISGARIEARATPAYTGARSQAMAEPTTDGDGRFSLRLPAGVSSRVLRFAYRLHAGDALAVATRTLRLSVRAGIALTIAPRTASVGRSIFFRGHLRGGPVPSDGKQLVLEARSPGGRWIEFDVARTDSRGRYRASYRFKFPGPADYQFRVVSEPESDYPFQAGASPTVGVFER
jgi:type 1 fimbria pilin